MRQHAVDEACGDHTGVGDEHRARDAEGLQFGGEAGHRARTVHEPGRDADGANGVDLHGHALSLARLAQGVSETADASRCNRARRHRSVSTTSLNVNTWKPASFGSGSASTGASPSTSGSGLKPARRRMRVAQLDVPAQEPHRLAEPDLRRDAHELGTRNSAGHADMDRQPRPSAPHLVHPRHRHPRVEADLAHDVRREASLVEHRSDRRLVRDQRMALRVAGDPDVFERMPELCHRLEQRRGAVERSGRLLGVPGDHEHVAHAELARAGRRSPRGAARSATSLAERCGATS